uniref:Uncharacterized protein n=1 Tax=Neogobius melanostomus TaxID=47308 RepID=A0A8C6UE18_9GOBI
MGITIIMGRGTMAHHTDKWNSDLLSCCDSMSTCCYGLWCCPCMACSVAAGFGENRCLPLCDIFSPAILAACGIPLFVHRYRIKGTLCKDICTSCFCEWCSYCQMHRELKYREKNHTNVVNMQPQ